jgi:hypothetical protein
VFDSSLLPPYISRGLDVAVPEDVIPARIVTTAVRLGFSQRLEYGFLNWAYFHSLFLMGMPVELYLKILHPEALYKTALQAGTRFDRGA